MFSRAAGVGKRAPSRTRCTPEAAQTQAGGSPGIAGASIPLLARFALGVKVEALPLFPHVRMGDETDRGSWIEHP